MDLQLINVINGVGNDPTLLLGNVKLFMELYFIKIYTMKNVLCEYEHIKVFIYV